MGIRKDVIMASCDVYSTIHPTLACHENVNIERKK